MRIAAPADGGVFAARAMILAVVVSMLLSTSVSVGLEFATYLVFMLAPAPRFRLIGVMRHPLVIALLPLAAVIVIATLYGAASWADALRSLFAWRRLLLLPLAAAVFYKM